MTSWNNNVSSNKKQSYLSYVTANNFYLIKIFKATYNGTYF